MESGPNWTVISMKVDGQLHESGRFADSSMKVDADDGRSWTTINDDGR